MRLQQFLATALAPLLLATAAHAQTWDWHLNNGFAGAHTQSVAFEQDGTMWLTSGYQGDILSFDGKGWKHYNSANTYDGLPSALASAIGVDKSGNRWIGFDSTLSRFDGKQWTVYTTRSTGGGLIPGKITSIAADRNKNLWIAAESAGQSGNGGLSKFDGKVWVNYTASNTSGEFYCQTTCKMLVDAQDKVWLAAGDNVYRFDGRNWTTYNQKNTGNALRGGAFSIAVDKRGTIWVGGFGQVASFDGSTWRAHSPFADPFGKDEPKIGVFDSLGIDSSGTVWAYASGLTPTTVKGLYRFEGNTWRYYDRHVSAMGLDPQNRFWFFGDDISEFDGAFRVRHNEAHDNSGLPYTETTAILADAQGAVWTGLRGRIGVLKGKQWTQYTTENTGNAFTEDESVASIASDNKDVRWFAVGYDFKKTNALVMKNGSQWRRYTSRELGFELGKVREIVVDHKQQLWAATAQGVVRFDGSSWKQYTQANTQGGLASDNVESVALDSAGKVWFGSSAKELMSTGKEGGVSSFDGQKWTTYTYENTNWEIPTNNAGRLRFDANGTLWVAVTASMGLGRLGGLTSFDGKKWHKYPEQVAGVKLPYSGIYGMAADARSGIWIGTAEGLTYFNGKDIKTLNRENTRNGLIDDRVLAVAVDRQGSVWASSAYFGISVYKPTVKESNTTASVLPQRQPALVAQFEELPETKAAAAAVLAEAAEKKRTWEEASLEDLTDVFCLRFRFINPNTVGSKIKEMEATRFAVEDFFKKSQCQSEGYSNAVKSPILHLVWDDPTIQEKTLNSVWLYYSKRRKQPELFGQMLNVRNSKGETSLDYMESMRQRKLLSGPEAWERMRDFACEHGAVYAVYKLQCPAR